jgi:microcystin-dependent protein
MANPFVAEIRILGFNFAPQGWSFCNGQLLPISQNTALFSLLGSTYGGDGRSTFGLPNLQDAAAVGAGSGPSLTPRSLGETLGAATHTLLTTEMPQHNHGGGALTCSSGPGTSNVASGRFPAVTTRPLYADTANRTGGGSSAGGGQPHENRQPYLALNFCIAMQGIYPPRN